MWKRRVNPQSMLGALKPERYVESCVSLLKTLMSPFPVLVLVYVFALVLSSSLESLPQTAFVQLLMCITRFLCLILVPGLVLCELTLPREIRSIWACVILGLLWSMIALHLAFTLQLVLGTVLPAISWLQTVGLMQVLVGSYCLRNSTGFSSVKLLCGRYSREILVLMLIGLIVRLVLEMFTQGCIAPDAALYADYARQAVQGQFRSSIANDTAVTDLWMGVQYVTHQGFVYLFVISWLLMVPTTSGPTTILMIAGLLIIPTVYNIMQVAYGESRAMLGATIVAVHPLFVFYSSVAYGPEITSLLLVVLLIMLIQGKSGQGLPHPLAQGLIVGFIDAIWYANFYVICAILPVLLYGVRACTRVQSTVLVLVIGIVLLGRQSIVQPGLFAISWALALVVPSVLEWRRSSIVPHGLGRFVRGLFVMVIIWNWPIQLASLTGISGSVSMQSGVVDLLSTSFTLELLTRFVAFCFFHVSAGVLVLVFVSLKRLTEARYVSVFTTCAAIAASGTFAVFGLFDKEVLLPAYIYSDSRFLIAMCLFCVLAIGGLPNAWLAGGVQTNGVSSVPKHVSFVTHNPAALAVLVLVVLGFAPGYAAYPTGLALVDIESRYGWTGLRSLVNDSEMYGSLFLVDRAREFSWYTSSQSVVLSLTSENLPSSNAAGEIHMLATEFNATRLLVDGYTIAHWKTLEVLYTDRMSIETVLPLDASMMFGQAGNETGSIPSIRLLASTEDGGDYVRIFSFCDEDYELTDRIDFLASGWGATDSGSISNHSGTAGFDIPSNMTSTTIWRPAGYDLNLTTRGGILLMSFPGVGANVTRVELWNDQGQLIRYADPLGEGLFSCLFGEVTIGDIRVIVEGSSGGYVLVTSASIWACPTA